VKTILENLSSNVILDKKKVEKKIVEMREGIIKNLKVTNDQLENIKLETNARSDIIRGNNE